MDWLKRLLRLLALHQFRLLNPGDLGFANSDWREGCKPNSREACWNVAHFMNMAQIAAALLNSWIGHLVGAAGCEAIATGIGKAWEAVELTNLTGFHVDINESKEDVGFSNKLGIQYGLSHPQEVLSAMGAQNGSAALVKLTNSAIAELTSDDSTRLLSKVLGSEGSARARTDFLKSSNK